MSMKALAIICTGIAIIVFIGAATHEPFGKGVRNSAECQANPGNWWCSLWGAGED